MQKSFILENQINYEEIIKKFPWIIERGEKAIISPDTDGFLCGLVMSSYLNWEIVGFYDGKILLLKGGVRARDCIFLDMEILRENIRSTGHHMNIHTINKAPLNYHKVMSNCINPNYIRKFDRMHNFRQKYPFGNIHLLLYLLEKQYSDLVKIKKQGLGALFFADGIWKILFKYTDNVLDWFDYLHAGFSSVWWEELKKLSVIELIEEINVLLHKLKKIHPRRKAWYGHIELSDFNNQKTLLWDFLKLLSSLIGWECFQNRWDLESLKKYEFKKEIYEGSKSNAKFFEIWEKKPLSLAMTEGSTIQYTLEEPDKLP